jgi:HAMP domain-containing protein
METKYFSLGTSENNRFVKIIQIVFGIACFAVAIFWLIFNIRSLKADGTLWITVIFLSGFGFYQIWSGLGRATRFIEIGQDKIRLKKISILPLMEIRANDIEKIEIFPFNLIFLIRPGKKIFLRFGTTYTDNIEPIKNGIIQFSLDNNISVETKIEEI